MILSSLLETYPEAQLSKGEPDSNVVGICKPEVLRDNHLCYLKNKKFLSLATESLESSSSQDQIGFVIESKIKDLCLEALSGFEPAISFIVEVPSIDEALCHFSKPFYTEKMNNVSATQNYRDKYLIESPNCEIAEDVFIGDNVTLGDHIVIHSGVRVMSNVVIGDHTIIYPNTVIYPFSYIGQSCRIHSQVTIGADGFGYNFINGQHMKIWHFGGVQIGDFVEVGASSCIDAGSFQPTIVGSGTKIDNLVQVGHNAELGEHVVVCGQAGLAGSARVDSYCALGGKVAIGPSAHIGMASQLAGGAMVTGVWPAKSRLAGYPAFEANKWLRSISKFKKLGERKKS